MSDTLRKKAGIKISEIPLIVDLDGTLIKTDMLYESFLLLMKKNLWFIFAVPFWLFKGKYRLKNEISKRVTIDPAALPYNQEFLEYLKRKKGEGRKLVLATATHKRIATVIANYLNLFSQVYASENGINLKSEEKRDLLVEQYGENRFDYAGNSQDDLVIFDSCHRVLVVNASKQVTARARKRFSNVEVFGANTKFAEFFKAIRVYQWVKNSLVFVPLVTSQNWNDPEKLKAGILTFFCFSFIASGGYLLNDLLDLRSDRMHPNKRHRPIASGNLSIPYAMLIMASLLLLGFGISLLYFKSIFFILLVYFTVTMSYSIQLKRLVLIDLFILTMLYTLRIIAGGIAINVELSFWLLAFSVFIFFSLAAMKRCAELIPASDKSNGQKIAGRGYAQDDLLFLMHAGTSCGYIGVVIFALYINSREVTLLYDTPRFLWIACLLLMFWISYLWHSTHKKKMTDDPIIFSFKDKTSIATLALIALVILMSI